MMNDSNKEELEKEVKAIVEICNVLDDIGSNDCMLRIFDYMQSRYLKPLKFYYECEKKAVENLIAEYEEMHRKKLDGPDGELEEITNV